MNHKKSSFILLSSLGLLIMSVNSFATEYKFDTKKTKIKFTLNFFGSMKKQGSFQHFSGNVNYLPNNINASSLALKIDTKSLNIDLPTSLTSMVDGDLFNTKQYPYMHFKSTKLSLKKQGQRYHGKITGVLNFMGKAHNESFNISFKEIKAHPKQPTKLIFRANSVIKRAKYGVSLPAIARVDNNIPISITGILSQ